MGPSPCAGRGCGGRRRGFESRVLPLCARRTRAVRALIPELYLHGLAAGDSGLALRGLLGTEAPLSASTVARLKARWQGEWEAWATRRLGALEVVCLGVDGVYVKAGLAREKAALLIAVAGLSDGRKVVVAGPPAAAARPPRHVHNRPPARAPPPHCLARATARAADRAWQAATEAA